MALNVIGQVQCVFTQERNAKELFFYCLGMCVQGNILYACVFLCTRLKGKKCLIALRYQEVKRDTASDGKDDSGSEGLTIATLIKTETCFIL